MRLDKLLWSFRYYKTRSIAANACKNNHVKVNGVVSKPSKDVFVSDKIQIRKDQINYIFTVIDVPKSRLGAKLLDQYRTDETPKEQFESKEFAKLAQDYYRKKGTGRPTKKDRRDIEDYKDSNEEIKE